MQKLSKMENDVASVSICDDQIGCAAEADKFMNIAVFTFKVKLTVNLLTKIMSIHKIFGSRPYIHTYISAML